VVGKEFGALRSVKQEVPDEAALITPQLLHHLWQEERHLPHIWNTIYMAGGKQHAQGDVQAGKVQENFW
jgi:hypothetical protein